MHAGGLAQPRGTLGLRIVRADETMRAPLLTVKEIMTQASPMRGLPDEVNAFREENRVRVARHLTKLGPARWVAHKLGLPFFWSELWGRVIKRDGMILDYGLLGIKVVTDVGVGFIVDAFQNITEIETMKYHGIGTGGTAEAAADTALVTELTTQYIVNSTRATGTTIEGASANIFKTVATNTVDSAVAITEHGIFSDPTVASGVLLDRTLFSVINLTSGDSLESTYQLTLTAGS